MMMEQCLRYQISLNLRKCIFCAPFGAILGHVVYSDGILVDPTEISTILDLPQPTTVKKLRETLGHMEY